jgi:hypothetical protein
MMAAWHPRFLIGLELDLFAQRVSKTDAFSENSIIGNHSRVLQAK